MHSQEEPPAIRQAWGLPEPARRGPAPRFTVTDVVQHAVALADEAGAAGIGAVTLAAVAQRLGLTTTGLYRYVDSKDLLDELVVDAALGQPSPLPTGPADRQVHAWVDDLWARYEAHPWLASVPLRRAPRCPNAYAWLAQAVTALSDAGDDRPVATAVTLDTLVRGYAQQAQVAAHATTSAELAAEITRRHPQLAAGDGTDGAADIDPLTDLHAAVAKILGVP